MLGPGEEGRTGRVTAVRGSVVEVAFSDGLPAINEDLRVSVGERTITLEVAHHVDPRTVRAIAMAPTEGLARGMAVARTGQPIMVPVGPSHSAACSTSLTSRWMGARR